MTPQPLPEAWRSEAFAEDLPGAEASPPEPRWRSHAATLMLGVLPVLLATAGAALAAWVSI